MNRDVISADCHLLEPGDLWTTRLPAHLRDEALRIEFDDRYIHTKIPGAPTMTLTRYVETEGDFMEGYESYDERARRLTVDGVAGELVHANMGLLGAGLPDAELAQAHARVYNDFVIEMFDGHLGRHKPTALLSLLDVNAAVAEAERVAARGIQALMIPAVPPKRYATNAYDRLWSVAQANDMTVCIHGPGRVRPSSTAKDLPVDLSFVQDAEMKITGFAADEAESMHANRLIAESQISLTAQEVIADFVGGGTFSRFPELHLIAVEFNAYWLAGLMIAMDKAYTIGIGQDVSARDAEQGLYDPQRARDSQPTMFRRFGMNDKWPFELRPSDYVRRNVHATFQDDPGAIALRHFTGIDCLLWGSDYPHHEGCWPRSMDCIDAQFAGVADDERQKMTGGTVAGLFGFDLTTAA